MKTLFYFLIIIFLTGCEKYEEVSEPILYMGGGKWTFVDYDVVVISAQSDVEIIKNDTICVNSFTQQSFVSGNIVMSQNYKNTAMSRRFIKNKTMWEFDGYNLYCDWVFQPGGQKPSHQPFWVSYPTNGLYTNYTKMSILDHTLGLKTDYTFKTNNIGVAPPSELILMSPEIVTDLYLSDGTREKAVTVKIILTFIR
jgi:hypothetical protein